jgi:hypothetical protein
MPWADPRRAWSSAWRMKPGSAGLCAISELRTGIGDGLPEHVAACRRGTPRALIQIMPASGVSPQPVTMSAEPEAALPAADQADSER